MKSMAAPRALLVSLFLVTSFLSAQTQPQLKQSNNIIQGAEASQNHKTLLAAVRAADLEETLESDGPFTVFAPSDWAFSKLSSEKVNELLLPENKNELKALLTYHIVAGNLTASKILKAMCRGAGTAVFTTVQGEELIATMDGIDIVLTDCAGNTARIMVADSNQRNGVIHEIDSVILPRQL